jgi:acyl transferase domain-containing protein/NADPH:quinone reductase-like Zn-dependent oxidoreductase/short-subunit dehydrogenase/SAM-dependent methyltransferase/acyl carrier protein
VSLSSSRSIFIVGRSCRLPGANSVPEFWHNLKDGRSSIGTIGPDRWDTARFLNPRPREPGRSYTFAAGIISNIWGFDAAAFGISPREAAQMDPQQRLALELVWEALEDAHIRPSRLAAGRVGVYAGASALDYGTTRMFDAADSDAHFMTGNTLSLISNRISHVFDLKGPSLTIDTACSSSLVAVHQACEALRAGEIELAVVVGVNLLLSPFPFIGFAQASMLAPDGLCKPFDAKGNGYVRSEGGVALVLSRSDTARVAAPRRYARVVATGINSDGRTIGVSLPSADRQADLLRNIYARAGVDTDALSFIEAHGTGTAVGDPAEARALGRALGQGRSRPLLIGSVKSNIGHLEPASGVAGLLKAVLALEHNLLPASLHFDVPNPEIPFADLNLQVAAENVHLKRRKRPRLAGISSFGFGGTNAHVVIADSPADHPRRAGTGNRRKGPMRSDHLLMLSAMTAPALKEMAHTYAGQIGADASFSPQDWGATIAASRGALPERAVFLANARPDLVADMQGFAQGHTSPRVIVTRAPAVDTPVAFVFSGNGAQWPGMGRLAYRHNSDFRSVFDEIDAIHSSIAEWSLHDALMDDALHTRLGSTLVAQPLLFAVQIALVHALGKLGLSPDTVLGHSVGEVAAAHVCGMLSLDDAVRVIAARSACLEPIRGAGSMAAVRLGEADAREIASSLGLADIEIAAINSPCSVTLVGESSSIASFDAHAQRAGIGCKVLSLDYPFHSAKVEPAKPALLAALKGLKVKAPRIPFVSTVTGAIVDTPAADAQYWWRNMREPVRFASAVEAAGKSGAALFIEIGPRPVLQGYLRECFEGADFSASLLGGLNETDASDIDPVRVIAAKAIANGARVDADLAFGHTAKTIELPAYPWQRVAYRTEATPEALGGFSRAPQKSPLLGWQALRDDLSWRLHVDVAVMPWLAGHRVNGEVVFPGTGFVEMALAAGRTWLDTDAVELQDVEVVHPLVLPDDQPREVRVRIMPDTATVEIASRRRLTAGPFETHAICRVFKLPAGASPPQVGSAQHRRTIATASAIYAAARRQGLHYGAEFQRARRVRRVDSNTLEVTLDRTPDGSSAFGIDPIDLDAAFHGLFVVADRERMSGCDPFIPIRFGRVALHNTHSRIAKAHLTIRRASRRSLQVDARLFDAEDRVIAEIADARFAATPLTQHFQIDDVTYHEVAVPLADPDRRPARLPSFATLVSTATDQANLPAGFAEPLLLLEAAARRIAHDALLSLDHHSPGRRFPDALRQALAQHAYSREEAKELPPASDIIRTVLAEHPAWSADCVLLTAAAEALGATEPASMASPATRDHFHMASPRNEVARLAVVRLLRAALMAPSRDRPARICIRGIDHQLAHEIAGVFPGGTTHIVLAETDRRAVRRARLALERVQHVSVVEVSAPSRWPEEHTAFDAIVSTGLHRFPHSHVGLSKIADALAPGAPLICTGPLPDAFHDVVFGLDEDWFDRSLHPSFPIGHLRTREEWVSDLESAGFTGCDAIPLGDSHILAVATGRKESNARSHPHPEIARPEAQVVQLEPIGGRRSALYAALRNQFSPADESAARDIVALAEDVADTTGNLSSLIAARLKNLADLLTAPSPQSRRRVWIVCSGGGVGERNASPVASALWAFGRTAANEMPELDIRLVGIEDTVSPEQCAEGLAALMQAPIRDRELVITRQGISALRIRRGTSDRLADTARRKRLPAHAVLDQRRHGALSTIVWHSVPTREVQAHEVAIKVAASGLNFRDVMWAQGLLAEEALEDGLAGPTLGLECSGEVMSAGAGVAHLAPGDRVVALAPHALATHVTVSSAAVIKLPSDIDLTSAATIPVAFLTAIYALEHLAHLKAGEWILIHGASGGVGLAALQIARASGARIIATAGTDEKRALLRLLGADHVLSSRSLAFARDVMELTGGVDVILNALAGEAMERSLGLLRPFGRFLELGKRDFYANTKIGLRPLRHNITYFGIDLDQLLAGQTDLAAPLMRKLMQRFQDGSLTPLPYRRFDSRDVHDAFRLMQQSAHIGKIVITPPGAPPAPTAGSPFRVTGKGIHIITGGLGGFGLATAAWLADRGARTIALVGRTGTIDEPAKACLAQLRAQNVDVRVYTCDVSDQTNLASLLAALRQKHRIKGVVHAAMVLDDALLANFDRKRAEYVLRPKIDGAVNLDRLTRTDTLGYFFLYSSVTTLIGAIGQSAYVAANGFLEGLARKRRAEGLPALAVRWGAIADVGVLAKQPSAYSGLPQRLGLTPLRSRVVLDMLGEAISEHRALAGRPVITIAPISWSRAAASLRILKLQPFAELWEDQGLPPLADTADLARQLAAMPDAEALKLLRLHLGSEIATILRLPQEDVDPQRSLAALGMDSLMGVELRLAVTRKLGIDLPLASLGDGLTVESMARKTLMRMRNANGTHLDHHVERHAPAPLADNHLRDLHAKIDLEASRSATVI